MIKSGFDLVAPYYDFLARLVFGRAIRQAQTVFLNHIPAHSRILIIGGGTGWLLPEITSRLQPRKIVFLEASQNMLNLARQHVNIPGQATWVEFRLGTENDIRPEEVFDVIISHFFLDLFLPAQLENIAGVLFRSLRPGGYWLVADFVKTPGYSLRQLWTKFLTRGMYLFFRLMSGISATTLPDWEKLLSGFPLALQKSAYYYHCMIRSVLYQKN